MQCTKCVDRREKYLQKEIALTKENHNNLTRLHSRGIWTIWTKLNRDTPYTIVKKDQTLREKCSCCAEHQIVRRTYRLRT